MAKVTWLGENTETYTGPSLVEWCGLKFPIGVAVEVSDPDQLRRARGSCFFKVEEGKKQQEDSHGAYLGESQTQVEDKKEDKEKGYDYREKEKGSGYSPVKKKVRKKKPAAEDSPERTAARVSTPNP